MAKFSFSLCLAALAAAPIFLSKSGDETEQAQPASTEPSLPRHQGMTLLPDGSFVMGSQDDEHPDQNPAHRVKLDGFWMDEHPVTNQEFAQFIEATGYATTAERNGYSLVLQLGADRWQEVAGADWQHPHGPQDSIQGKQQYPVVHISWHDAVAFANWANKRLPTEAEYEYAARSGINDAIYPWGNAAQPGGAYQANGWQGWFPDKNRKLDGYGGTSPVGSFPANSWGLYDIAGNVWCWCADWYDQQGYAMVYPKNPIGPSNGTERVLRGGSWQSSHNHEGDLNVAFRGHARPQQTTNHIGFRCVRRDEKPERVLR